MSFDPWENLLDSKQISDEHFLSLLNDRIFWVDGELLKLNFLKEEEGEAVFDLIMLIFDSLQLKRKEIKHLVVITNLSQNLVCKAQSHLLGAISRWHSHCGIANSRFEFFQNIGFLILLYYLFTIWLEDDSSDLGILMAKTSEALEHWKNLKRSPLSFMEYFK